MIDLSTIVNCFTLLTSLSTKTFALPSLSLSVQHRLYLITFFEKFTVNGFGSILILYAIHHLKMTEQQAFECVGTALGLGLLTPILGGLLAGWFYSIKTVILLSLTLMVIVPPSTFLTSGVIYG